jgi:hypothetical protein
MSNGKVASPPRPARPQSPASPRSPTLSAQFVLDESAIAEPAREANQKWNQNGRIKPAPWAGNQADYEVGAGGGSVPVPRDGIVRIGIQVPLPRSPSLPPAAPPPAVTATLKKVQRLGSYSVPIDWKLDGTTSAPVSPANPSMKVEITGRVRLSAWAKPTGKWVDDKGKTKRFARDRWKGLDARWGLDDITFTQTVRILDPQGKIPKEMPLIKAKPDPDAVWWADNFLPTIAADKDRTDWMRDAIQFFHAHNIQVFAGYEIVIDKKPPGPKPPESKEPSAKEKEEFKKAVEEYKEKNKAKLADVDRDRRVGDAFVLWLEGKGRTMSDFEEHAKKLVGFFDDRGLDIDGISYDLEIDEKYDGRALGRRHAEAIQALYLAVMHRLSVKERYLAFAAAGRHDSTIMQEQPYRLGNIINILARTMSYQVVLAGSKQTGAQAREDVVKESLRRFNLHPSHLQIGLTTREGQPGKITVEEATKECPTYRSHRVGLAHWYLDILDLNLGQYRDYDKALNPTAPPRGTRGQPLQGPLGPQRLKAFKDAKAAEDKEKGTPAAK